MGLRARKKGHSCHLCSGIVCWVLRVQQHCPSLLTMQRQQIPIQTHSPSQGQLHTALARGSCIQLAKLRSSVMQSLHLFTHLPTEPSLHATLHPDNHSFVFCMQELVIRVKLLGVQQACQAQLNIQPDSMSLSVPGKYHLDLPLPYKVAEADGSASFNAAKQQLEVILPVVPLPLPRTASRSDRNLSQQEQQVQSSDGKTSVTRQPSSAMDSGNQHGFESSSGQVSDGPDAADAAPQDVDESDQASTSSSSSRQQQGSGVDTDSKGERLGSHTQRVTKNQRKWLELHPVASTSTPSPAVQSEATPTVETVSPDTLLAAAAAGTAHAPCIGIPCSHCVFVYAFDLRGKHMFDECRSLRGMQHVVSADQIVSIVSLHMGGDTGCKQWCGCE